MTEQTIVIAEILSYNENAGLVVFNASNVTESLMDRLLKILYDKNVVKWNDVVAEGYRYVYEYTGPLIGGDSRSFRVTLLDADGKMRTSDEFDINFSVSVLEEV